MASAGRLGFFGRRERASARALDRLAQKTITIHSPRSALYASAARLDVADKDEAKVQRMLRQGWQAEAWNLRDSIGELRFAVNFLANCTARMRVFPACYPIGGESDYPVALEKVKGVPPEAVSAAGQAIAALGNGRMAISGMLHRLSANKTVAGESYLLGRTDEQTGVEEWSVRSVHELVVEDTTWYLREVPADRQNAIIPWIPLDPELTVISRMWTPHPAWELLADSALKAMLDDGDSLMILRRMIRAAGRSRLASRGLLLIPDELSIKAPLDDDEDPEADPFMRQLSAAMMAPIVNEGTSDGVVPIVVRGPAELLKEVRLVEMAQTFDEHASKTREELIGIIATSLDLPKETIMGITDLNHWSAWSVSADLFREHVEPHVISCCDDLSGAYLRPYLAAAGIDPMWVDRMALWYDPTELIAEPDRAAAAEKAFGAMAISGKAYRAANGWTDEDAPTPAELEARRLWDIRALPLNLLMEYARRADPTLVVPPITVSGTVPGIKLGGVDVGELPAAPVPGSPALPPVAPGQPPPPAAEPAQGPPPAERPPPSPPPSAVTAAGVSKIGNSARLSRKLASIDSDLRARLQTAANAAMLRQLERAGARLRTKVAKDETLRTRIAHRANERVSAILGPEAVAAAGLTASELMGNDWSGLRSQFYAWTEAAQKQAIHTALRIGNLEPDSDAAARAETAMAAGRDAGWTLLSDAMTSLGHSLLYSPDPNVGPGDWAELNPDTLVPTGMIRGALGVAGGADTGTAVLDQPASQFVGQIGTGATISDLLTSAGAEVQTYTWVHGPSLHPLEGHEELDGVEFETFDDDQLANSGDFPDNAYYLPGDHDGCLCDFQPNWMSPTDETPTEE